MTADISLRERFKRFLLDAEYDGGCRVRGWAIPSDPPARSLLFQTVAWGDYQWFIPTYVYTALRAYPDSYVRIIYRETLAAGVREALALVRDGLSDHFEVIENAWPHTPFYMGTRWLLGDGWWRGYEFGHIGDVDLLIYPEQPTLLEFERARAGQLGKPFSNSTQLPQFKKMAGYSHFVICGPYFAALRPVQEKFIDDPRRLLLRDCDPSLPVQHDACGGEYQLCLPQALGNDEYLLCHLIDTALGAPPILTPQPPWAVPHGIHLGALRTRQPWWRLVGGARPPDELDQAAKILREPLYRKLTACLDDWFWDAQDQLIADVVLHRQRR